MTDETFKVPEVHCDHCVTSIQGAVSALPGVKDVRVSLEDTTVAVTYNEEVVARSSIVGTIEEQGYAVSS